MPEQTVSRDQFKRLAEDVLKDAPTLLKARDKSDKAMDKKSALLQALLARLREKLGVAEDRPLTTRGFKTYEFAIREALQPAVRGRAALFGGRAPPARSNRRPRAHPELVRDAGLVEEPDALLRRPGLPD